nr:MAG TPA: hypothetical protein [Microviridae sp.]
MFFQNSSNIPTSTVCMIAGLMSLCCLTALTILTVLILARVL